MLPERYRRNPPQRPSPSAADPLPEPEPDPNAWDEADELDAELDDAAFLDSLRRDIQGVRDGTVNSIAGAMRPALQDRPRGRRHKRRDRHGKAF